MSFFANPLSRRSQVNNPWVCAGLVSSYPNIDGSSRIGGQQPCNGLYIPGCRVFSVPREKSLEPTEVAIDDWNSPESGSTRDQVMVFQYKGKIMAIDHVGYSLSLKQTFLLSDAPLCSPSTTTLFLHAALPSQHCTTHDANCCCRSVRILLTPCLTPHLLTSKISVWYLALVSFVLSTIGLLIFILDGQTAATTSCMSGRFSKGRKEKKTTKQRFGLEEGRGLVDSHDGLISLG